jgi:hypothetical protein
VAARTGWFRDPLGRHRLRYRRGEWTAWVSDTGDGFASDALELDHLNRRYERRQFIGIIAAIAAVAILVGGVILAMHDAEFGGVDEAITEMNHWRLPSTVARSKRRDHVERGTLAATSPTVTRWYVPASGASPKGALNDLAHALKAQGYDLFSDVDLGEASQATRWSGHLKTSKYDSLEIALDRSGELVEVVVSLGS